MSCDTPAPRTATRCGPCSPSERNRYFRGKKLTVADFELEQDYLVGRRRLINRAMLGWGVVEGFAIDLGEAGIKVGPGMALDARGRELVACEPVDLDGPDDLLWLTRDACGWTAGDPPREPDEKERDAEERTEKERYEKERLEKEGYAPGREGQEWRRRYLLRAHYAEAPVDGIRIEDGCGDARCEGNHLCETVVYSLTPDCAPGLPDCACEHDSCAREPSDPRWGQEVAVAVEDAPRIGAVNVPQLPPFPGRDPHIAALHDRGPQDQLVDWSVERQDPELCGRPRLTRVGHLRVALDDGVPIACVALAFHCGKPRIVAPVDHRRARRLAYPNNALFDLIRGCDLTRIQDVGWRRWLPRGHRKVPFEQFAAMFEPPARPQNGPKTRKGRTPRPPVDTRFWVGFSGPVQISSLTADILTMTLVQRDTNEDVGSMYRVPIEEIAVADTSRGDPPGTTRAFRPMVAARFWEGEINPENSSGFEGDTLVEIEVRTGFIVDARGQEVAGGGRYVPSNGCVPGGRFLTSFVVLAEQDGSGTPGTAQPGEAVESAVPDPKDSIKTVAAQPPQEA